MQTDTHHHAYTGGGRPPFPKMSDALATLTKVDHLGEDNQGLENAKILSPFGPLVFVSNVVYLVKVFTWGREHPTLWGRVVDPHQCSACTIFCTQDTHLPHTTLVHLFKSAFDDTSTCVYVYLLVFASGPGTLLHMPPPQRVVVVVRVFHPRMNRTR